VLRNLRILKLIEAGFATDRKIRADFQVLIKVQFKKFLSLASWH